MRNVRTVTETVKVICNAEAVVVDKDADFKGYEPIWYYKDAISNILSLSSVQEKFKVTFDSHKGNLFVVHRQ